MRTCLSCPKEVTGRKKYCEVCIVERQREAGRRYRKNGPQYANMARAPKNNFNGEENCTQCGVKFNSGEFTRPAGDGRCVYCVQGLSKVKWTVMMEVMV